MKTILKITAVLFLFVLTTSCYFDGVRGNGNVVTENRKISNDFIRVKASRGLDVYITKSSDLSLTVEADENLLELIQTDVIDGTLVITSSKNIGLASAKKIHLSVENLNEISVSSGAEIYSENTFYTDDLKIGASSGSEAHLTLNVKNLDCESSSGANINLSGTALSFEARSSSGSDINAYELNVKNCKAKATSGSGIKVNVTDSFEAKATSGADIKYRGNPKVVNKNKSSGGSVTNNS